MNPIEGFLYPDSELSQKAVTFENVRLMRKTIVKYGVKFFVTTLLLISPFISRAQEDSALNVSNLKKLSLEELLNIKVVTASQQEQKITEAPSTMIVITAEQIKERAYQQLDDVLRDIPGVELIHTYGHAPTFITFRGMYGDANTRVLFMIDGIVENSLMGGFEMAGPAYSLHNAERIEIIWGPGSALYGANAYSAVINIITKKGIEMNGLHYQKGFGSFNTSFENVMLGVKKYNLPSNASIDLSLSGSLYNTDGPRFTNRDPLYNNSYVNNAYSFSGNIIYKIKKFQTTFGARAFRNAGGLGTFADSPTNLLGLPSQGNQNDGAYGIVQSDFNGERGSYGETYARTAFLQSEYSPNSKFSIFLKAQYRETGVSDKSYVYLSYPLPNFPIFGQTILARGIFAYFANRIGGEISTNYSIAENHKLSAGVQLSQVNLERGFREINHDGQFELIENIPVADIHATFQPRKYIIQNNTGAYLQYVMQSDFLKKTNLTIGGRYDNNSIYGTTVNPRIGLINQPHEKVSFKLLYGSAFRAPTNFELYTALSTKIANPDLKPEKIQTYEANIIYTPFDFLLLQINLFQNELTDIIIFDVKTGDGKTQNQNVGTASIKGFEAKMDIVTAKSFKAFLNFTYQEGKQNDGMIDSEIPNIAKVKGNFGFSAQLAHLINVSLIANWMGERSVTTTNPLGKVNGYFTPNLVISTKNLFDNRVSASINIRNLFNQSYNDPGIGAADGTFDVTVHEQPGINALLKISISIY